MSSFRKALITFAALATAGAAWAQAFPGIGRPATPKELAAWDIDVRPDFKGLPKGQGTVAQGQDVWEAKCASCHGVKGEGNEAFGAPALAGLPSAYVARQLRQYRAGARGKHRRLNRWENHRCHKV